MAEAPSGTTLVTLPRHSLLTIDETAWATALASQPGLAAEPLLVEWAAKARPFIARRRTPCDRTDRIPAGVPLPPAQGKKRIVLELDPATVLSIAPMPLLETILAFAQNRLAKDEGPQVGQITKFSQQLEDFSQSRQPLALLDNALAPWLTTIDAIATLGQQVASPPRVFGSLAWAALTGLDYMSASSDLDLIWTVTPSMDINALLGGLERIERKAPGRIDGELVVPAQDVAVNWRELFSDAREILVKTSNSVMMQPRDWFFEAARYSA